MITGTNGSIISRINNPGKTGVGPLTDAQRRSERHHRESRNIHPFIFGRTITHAQHDIHDKLQAA